MRASECCGITLNPSNSSRSRVISSIMLGLFMNHQHPKIIRFLNFLPMTHNSCWFSRDRSVTKNLLSGCSRSNASKLPRSAFALPSPAIWSSGFTARLTPIISANGTLNSRETGRMQLLNTLPRMPSSGYRKSGGSETAMYFGCIR